LPLADSVPLVSGRALLELTRVMWGYNDDPGVVPLLQANFFPA
jgi:hypothetical protein